ncbi:MAG: recombinase family protein [Solirubrobacteraceae bacterium]
MSAQQKIETSHLERLAVVYLRQSTPRQVREHFRSTERQYALAEEAARLGWQAERVVVIDGDLGVSGRDAEPRESYKGAGIARVPRGGRRDPWAGGREAGTLERRASQAA